MIRTLLSLLYFFSVPLLASEQDVLQKYPAVSVDIVLQQISEHVYLVQGADGIATE